MCESNMSSSSLCPHLVQEYFERVSDILATYRPQILKQVEYDKISENLVLRGAVRQEEHQRIFHCVDLEGQVSQMLVVIQNRMWGLENLLAAFMEEHVSSWLTQELFRAYMEHLVIPLRKQRESPVCQCVQMPNSILYRGWVRALKSLDSLILKTGTSLGFMKGTMYPTDNMLAFLSEKLAEYTGGDSCSSAISQDDLVPYGFAPNSSGEVQVAELEEDDINDLISLSETLSIAYHSSNEITKTNSDVSCASEASDKNVAAVRTDNSSEKPNTSKPIQRNMSSKRKGSGSRLDLQDADGRDIKRRERSVSEQGIPLLEQQHQEPISQSQSDSGNQDKLARQRELIARLSAPKATKTSSSTSAVHLRHSPSSTTESKQLSISARNKQRPRSAEFRRCESVPSPSPASSVNTVRDPKCLENRPQSEKKQAKSGKTQGFVRSKSHAPTSPKSNGRRLSPKSKPMAVAKPTRKDAPRKTIKSLNKQSSETDNEEEKEVWCSMKDNTNINIDEKTRTFEAHYDEDTVLSHTKLFNEGGGSDRGHDEGIEAILPGITSLTLSSVIFASSEEKAKSLAYYQLNFDNFSDNE